MTRLQTYSHRAVVLCCLFCGVLPVGIIFFWLTTQTDHDYLSFTGLVQYGLDIQAITHTELSIRTRVISIAVSLLYSSILMFALNSLIQLFKNYHALVNYSIVLCFCHICSSLTSSYSGKSFQWLDSKNGRIIQYSQL